MGFPRPLDEQEERIVKALIKNPRLSDNQVGKMTGVPVRTVSRKRDKLEDSGVLNYFAQVNMGPEGTARFGARHLYIVKFRLGLSQDKIIKELLEEPNIRTVFTEFIYESHIAEVEGHTALALIIEGKSDDEIANKFNGVMVPSLEKNHGKDSIDEIKTIRLSKPIRLFHNYLFFNNLVRGKMSASWPVDAIFVE
jgi:DNA-binding Lrp family transcriptional regulator